MIAVQGHFYVLECVAHTMPKVQSFFPFKFWIKTHMTMEYICRGLRVFFRERFGHVDLVFLTQISLSSFSVQANNHI